MTAKGESYSVSITLNHVRGKADLLLQLIRILGQVDQGSDDLTSYLGKPKPLRHKVLRMGSIEVEANG
jgi:hypothetical protein